VTNLPWAVQQESQVALPSIWSGFSTSKTGCLCSECEFEVDFEFDLIRIFGYTYFVVMLIYRRTQKDGTNLWKTSIIKGQKI
jgi:hypothetical protein